MFRSIPRLCLSLALILLSGYLNESANAAVVYSPSWFDGFDITSATSTSDINLDIATRQGGSPTNTSYVTAGVGADTWKHQIFNPGPLQLAGNAAVHTLVSPDFSFDGAAGGGVNGMKVEVVMDAYANNSGGSYFTQSAITVGANSTVTPAGSAGGGFSVVFVEDTFGGAGNFIQTWDGDNLLGNLIANPAGGGPGFVQILIDDPTDNNPWDGIGQTDVEVLVDSNSIGSWTVGGVGGYTSNFITLEGSDQKVGAGLATHTFENLTVFSGVSAIPEPSSFAFLAIVGAYGLRRRRSRSARVG